VTARLASPAAGVAALVAALIGLVAVQTPVAALGLAVGLLFVAACFVDLAFGLAAFTVLIFFEHFAGSTGVAKLAGVVLAGAWAITVIARGADIPFLGRHRPLLAGAVAVFFVITFSSALWAPDSGRAVSNAVRMLQVVVLYLIAYSAARDLTRVRWLIWAFMIGSFCAAAIGLVTGTGFANTDRLSGGILDPNFLAASLVAAAGMALIFALKASPSRRAILAVFVVTDLIALLRTESRGGVIAAFVVFAVVPIVAGPFRARAVAAVLIAAAVGLTYFSVAASVETKQRLTNITAGGGGGRSDQWSLALRAVNDHPLLGVGLGNFQVVESKYTAGDVTLQDVGQVLRFQLVVHNTYLEVLAELGPFGLLAFLVAIVGPLVAAARALRGDVGDALEIRALVVALSALLVGYFFLSGEYEKQLWLLAGLTLGAVDATRSAGEHVRALRQRPVRTAVATS
jgi:putative inorganic carbon (HCO3(-)) transporter